MMRESVAAAGFVRWTAVLAALVATALTWWAGHRGFFAFDQSIVFDGGYRIARGQMPFRDFVVPAGPVLLALQGIVFSVFGSSWGSYVATAAVLAGAGTWAACHVVHRLVPLSDSQFWVVAAGVLTAIWLYPVFGTPWFENTALVLGLLALLLIVPREAHREEDFDTEVRLATRAGGAGFLLALAFLCKQNAGVLFGAAVVLPVVLSSRSETFADRLRRLGFLVVGGGVGLGAFVAVVAIAGDLGLFIDHFWRIPSRVGAERLGRIPVWDLARHLIWTRDFTASGLAIKALTLTGGLALLLTVPKRNAHVRSRMLPAAVLAMGALVYQNGMMLVTRNHPWNSYGLVGIALGLVVPAAGLGVRNLLRDRSDEGGDSIASGSSPTGAWRLVQGGMGASIAGVLMVVGLYAASERYVHDPFSMQPAEFEGLCDVAILDEIRWGRPTVYGGRNLDCGNLSRLADLMRRIPGPTFFIGDLTLVHAMAEETPASPLLWYDRGLTYPPSRDPHLDAWFVDRIRELDVRLVIVETARMVDRDTDPLRQFPRLGAYVRTHFIEVHGVDHFRVFLRRQM